MNAKSPQSGKTDRTGVASRAKTGEDTDVEVDLNHVMSTPRAEDKQARDSFPIVPLGTSPNKASKSPMQRFGNLFHKKIRSARSETGDSPRDGGTATQRTDISPSAESGSPGSHVSTPIDGLTVSQKPDSINVPHKLTSLQKLGSLLKSGRMHPLQKSHSAICVIEADIPERKISYPLAPPEDSKSSHATPHTSGAADPGQDPSVEEAPSTRGRKRTKKRKDPFMLNGNATAPEYPQRSMSLPAMRRDISRLHDAMSNASDTVPHASASPRAKKRATKKKPNAHQLSPRRHGKASPRAATADNFTDDASEQPSINAPGAKKKAGPKSATTEFPNLVAALATEVVRLLQTPHGESRASSSAPAAVASRTTSAPSDVRASSTEPMALDAVTVTSNVPSVQNDTSRQVDTVDGVVPTSVSGVTAAGANGEEDLEDMIVLPRPKKGKRVKKNALVTGKMRAR